MPAIGAEVADAYIEVHADTGPFRRELRREATLAAREASDDFGVEFTKAIDKDLDPLGVKVARQLRKMGEIGGGNLIEGIADQVRARADRINTAFAQAITFGDFAPFIESFNNFDDAIEDFTVRLKQLNKDGTLTNKTFDRLNSSFNAYVQTIQDDAIAQALDEQRRASVAALEAEEKRVARQTQINDLFTRDFEKNVSRITKTQEKLTSALAETDREAPAFKAVSEDLDVLRVSLEKAERSVNRFNFGLGSLKGSRNDFLNFIGSLAGFLERGIGRGFDTLFRGIGSGVQSLGRSLADINGPLGSVGRGLDRFGASIGRLGSGGITGLAIQLAAVLVGLQALVVILGPLAAGISLLAGAFVALATAIGGALLGGITALGPGLAALAVGTGAVALGFSKMSKATKEAFTPLSDWVKEVRTLVQEQLFKNLGDSVSAISDLLNQLTPVLVASTAEFRRFGETLLESLASGPVQQSLQTLGELLPSILRSLLSLVGNLVTGLIGLFAAAAPGADRLFEAISRVVGQFSAWVNTREGQEQINAFMQQAVDILGILWGIITEVGAAFRTFWQEGAAGGQSLLDSLLGILENFNTWVSDEGGREQIRQWFDDAQQAAGYLGDAIKAAVDLFNELDNENTRAAFQFIILAIRDVIRFFETLARIGNNVWQGIIDFTVGAAEQVNRFTRFIGTLGDRFRGLGGTARRVWSSIGNAIQGVRRFLDGISRSIAGAISAFLRLQARAVNALARISGAVLGVGANIISGIIRGIAGSVGNLYAYVNQIADNIASTFAAALSIFSPSRVFRDFGIAITEGLALGIGDGERMVDNAVDNLVNASVGGNINAPISSLAAQADLPGGGSVAGGIAAGAIQIVTPYADPRLVALELLDNLAARGK